MFCLIRHGKVDYTERNTKIYQGFGVNLCPLTELGIAQIREAAKDPRLNGADVIVSSPYTRALQAAAILSKELGADIVIDTDLHGWIANKNYIYDTDAAAENSYREFEKITANIRTGKSGAGKTRRRSGVGLYRFWESTAIIIR